MVTIDDLPACDVHEEYNWECGTCLADAYHGCFSSVLAGLPGTTLEIQEASDLLILGWIVYGDRTIMKAQYHVFEGPSIEVPGHDWFAFRENLVWEAALNAERLGTVEARKKWAQVRAWDAHLEVPVVEGILD